MGGVSQKVGIGLCVGFLYTPMWSLLSFLLWTTQSKKGKLLSLTSSLVNLMFLSTEFMCSVKACTSLVLILTHVSSTYLNQWLGVIPSKEFKALHSTSSMYKFATIGETGEPMAQPCFCL